MGGDAEDVDGAGADLHDEQGVQPLEADGVHMEELSGEQAAGLGFEELFPFTVRRLLPGHRAVAGLPDHAADGGQADLVSESV